MIAHCLKPVAPDGSANISFEGKRGGCGGIGADRAVLAGAAHWDGMVILHQLVFRHGDQLLHCGASAPVVTLPRALAVIAPNQNKHRPPPPQI